MSGQAITPIDQPYHRLNDNTWLHDRPETDVFKLLIDTYRFRVEDIHKNQDGEVMPGSLYAQPSGNGLIAFRRFLTQVEARPGLLPSWWSPQKTQECLRFAIDGSSFSRLTLHTDKAAINQYYGDDMHMQMRLFGNKVYGTPVAGQDGQFLLVMKMMAERGELHTMSSPLPFTFRPGS